MFWHFHVFAHTNQMPQIDTAAYFKAPGKTNKQAGYDDRLVMHDTSRITDKTSRPVTLHLNAVPNL